MTPRDFLLLEPIDIPQYQSEFIDALRDYMGARNYAQLGRALRIPCGTITKLRSGDLRVSGGYLLRIYDTTGLSIEQLREMLYKRKFTAPQKPTNPAYLMAKERGYRRDTDNKAVPSIVMPSDVQKRHKKAKTREVVEEPAEKIVQIAPNIMRHRIL